MAHTPADKETDGNSKRWKNWMSELLLTTCQACIDLHGKIYPMEQFVQAPRHINGKCKVVPMRTVVAGTVSEKGEDGVDVYLMKYGRLPDYYVSKSEARDAGWEKGKKAVSDILPGKMIGGDIYFNNEGKLPSVAGRMWYEADFDYFVADRDGRRILYSNDGLIFVSYDHAKTFYELIKQGDEKHEKVHDRF